MRGRSLYLLVTFLLAAGGRPAAAGPPLTVSPGAPDAVSPIGATCPTFDWGADASVESWELVVYRLEGGVASASPVLRRRLPGAATGWTPDLGSCLAAGASYTWLLRGAGAEGAGPWSEARFFRIEGPPSAAEIRAALGLLERYLATRTDAPATPGTGGVGVRGGGAAGDVAPVAPPPAVLATPDQVGITSEIATTTGAVTFGLQGVSHSSDAGSAGVVGRSTAASGDVAGVSAQAASATGSAGVFDNTAAGDILRGLANGSQVFEVAGSGAVTATSFAGDGASLTAVDADTLDGTDSTAFLQTTALDSEAELEAILTDVSNVLTDNDTIDADTLDGSDSSAFMAASADSWVNESGDSMSGDLGMNGNSITEVAALSRTGANDLTLSSGQNLVLSAPSGDIQLNASASTIDLNAKTVVTQDDAAAAAVTSVLTVAHTTSDGGNGGAGIGAGVLLRAEDDAGAAEDAARLDAVLTNAGDGNEASELRFLTRTGGGALTATASLDGAGTLSATAFSGNGSSLTSVAAATAASLAANGANCAAGEAPVGVDAAGAAEGCADVATQSELDAHGTADAAAFVNVTGDTMTGTLTLDPTSGYAWTTGSGDSANLGGDLFKGGTLFLHDPGTANTGLGPGALNPSTSGTGHNTGVGKNALAANTTGFRNAASGSYTLAANTTGQQNTASGADALRTNTTGSYNTAIGDRALFYNTAGGANTATGQGALYFSTGGDRNTATGADSMLHNAAGSDNAAFGRRALFSNTSGSYNTASGAKALYGGTTGDRNVGIGYRAGVNATTGSNNIFIANEGVAAESAKIRVGTQGTQTATYVAGIYGSSLAGSPVVVTSAGRLGVASGATGDADTLDGLDSTQLLRSDASDSFTSGTLTLDGGTTLDVNGSLELPTTGISGGGSGSGLDADTLDGMSSAAFMPAATDDWVDEAGDTMSGDLDLGGNDLVGLGNVQKGGSLFLHASGSDNTGVGSRALSSNTGGKNTGLGAAALYANGTGSYNTAAGAKALYANTTGGNNTAAGDAALRTNTTGANNTAVGRHALYTNATGSNNTAIGYAALHYNTANNITAVGHRALYKNVGGPYNTAVGAFALENNTINHANTAVGYEALRANTVGGALNTAVGHRALKANTTGLANTSIGTDTMNLNTTGSWNTALGHNSLTKNTTGSYNTGLGRRSLYDNTTGSHNVAIGHYAGYNATTGDDNIWISHVGVAGESDRIRVGTQGTQTATYVAGIYGSSLAGSPVVVTSAGRLGVASGATGDADTLDGLDSTAFMLATADSWVDEAGDTMSGDLDLGGNDVLQSGSLFLHDQGTKNLGVGRYALDSNTTGSYATAVGFRALDSNTSGFGNTAVGGYALRLNTTGYRNTAVGAAALELTTTGTGNSAVGIDALVANTVGDENTATGDSALRLNTTGVRNTAVGASALRGNSTGGGNTAVGFEALRAATASGNSALGYRALYKSTTGNQNVAVGSSALYANVGGASNTAVGYDALRSNTSGAVNTAVGKAALKYNTSGFGNVAVGSDTLDVNSTGYGNTAVGHNNLTFSTTGNQNTAVGQTALYGNTTGHRNVGIGARAGYYATSGSDNIFILNEGVAGESAKIRVGTQGTQSATYVAGIYGSSLAGSPVVVTSAGRLGVASGATGDADTLDGLDSTAFMLASADSWVDEAGDTMSGNLDMSNHPIANIGDPATDFTATGGLTLADDLALENGETISNATDDVIRFSDGTDTFDIDLTGSTILKTGDAQQAMSLRLGAATTDNSNGASMVLEGGAGRWSSPSSLLLGGKIEVGGGNRTGGQCVGGNQDCGGHTTISGGSAASCTGGGNVFLRGGTGACGRDDGNVLVTVGKMGIGVSSPTEKLDVAGNVKATQFLGDGSALTGVAASTATTLAANGANCNAGEAALGVDAAGAAEGCYDISTQAELDAQAAANGTTYVELAGDTMTGALNLPVNGLVAGTTQLVLGSGRVGVGTASPAKALDVKGSGVGAGARIYNSDVGSPIDTPFVSVEANLFSTGSGILSVIDRRQQTALSLTPTVRIENSHASTVGSNPLLEVAAAGTNRLLVRQDGKVGIGESSPTHKLDVAGDMTVGAKTETLSNAGFSLDGNDLFVSGSAGVEGTIYTDSGLTVGASTVYADGSITQTTAGASLILNVAGGDAAGEDLVVTADNFSLTAGGAVTAASFTGDGSALTNLPAAAGLACAGCVDSGDIADGAIAFADLGQNGCSTNQIAKWNGSGWACSDDVYQPAATPSTNLWATASTSTGGLVLDHSWAELNQTGSSSGWGAELSGIKSFDPETGTLVFQTVVQTYCDPAIYGDFQPRGLVMGTDRNYAIEFVSASCTSVKARTVSAGSATETTVDIGQTIYDWNTYQIVATSSVVRFYVNGVLIATHTTNIPNGVSLNPYFSSAYSGSGSVPQRIDFVSFERILSSGDRVLIMRDDFDEG